LNYRKDTFITVDNKYFGGTAFRREQPATYQIVPMPSLWSPLLYLLAGIAAIEIAVELGMDYLDPLGLFYHVVVDTLMTFLAISPLIYLFMVRPNRLHHEANVRNQQEILHLSQQMICAEEDERKKLAKDLHDDFGQVLTALQFGVETLKGHCPDDSSTQESFSQQCDHLSELIAQLGDHVRSVSGGLRPEALDELGLVSALDGLIKDFAQESNLCHFTFEHDNVKDRFPPDVELALFRICQESLNNVLKHSDADQVRVELGRNEDTLLLKIEDNGVGFNHAKQRSAGLRQRGIGMLGMRERAALLCGLLSVVSSPGNGTCITSKIPTILRRKEDVLHQDYSG
jgi:signal transduction histidine kinase